MKELHQLTDMKSLQTPRGQDDGPTNFLSRRGFCVFIQRVTNLADGCLTATYQFFNTMKREDRNFEEGFLCVHSTRDEFSRWMFNCDLSVLQYNEERGPQRKLKGENTQKKPHVNHHPPTRISHRHSTVMLS